MRLLGKDVVDQRTLSGWISPLGRLAPLAFIAFLAVRPFTLLPGQLLAAVGGILFGAFWATVYAELGSFLAMSMLFLLARRYGVRWMKRLAKGKYPALARAAKHHDFKFALLTTINPLVPTDVAVAAAAASGARFWPTVGGVLLATAPGTALTAQFGSALSQGKAVLAAASAVGMVGSLVFGVMLGRRVAQDISNDRGGEERTPMPRRRSAPAAS
ncbi:MAG: TVP38/TMEM64 family protein [Myxococcales bacterium]|nr:TVP38/TMEM64 family protein [Myxococcales bacterium]